MRVICCCLISVLGIWLLWKKGGCIEGRCCVGFVGAMFSVQGEAIHVVTEW